MAYVIKEKRPDGKGSVRETLKWISNVRKTVLDSKSLFNVLIPDIKQSLKYEFSDANPNSWAGYKADKVTGKQRYLAWKRSKGFPDTIGIMSGALKKSLTSSARTRILMDTLIYTFDPNVSGYKGKKVGTYAKYFNKWRPIFGATVRFINNKIKKVALRKWRLKNIKGK